MNLTLDSEAMNAAMQKAVLDALGQQGQEIIVGQAVKYLLAQQPATGGYGSVAQPSPLMKAVNEATIRTAHTIVQQQFENNPEFVASIEGMVKEAFAKILNDSDARAAIVDAMSTGFRKALTGRDY